MPDTVLVAEKVVEVAAVKVVAAAKVEVAARGACWAFSLVFQLDYQWAQYIAQDFLDSLPHQLAESLREH